MRRNLLKYSGRQRRSSSQTWSEGRVSKALSQVRSCPLGLFPLQHQVAGGLRPCLAHISGSCCGVLIEKCQPPRENSYLCTVSCRHRGRCLDPNTTYLCQVVKRLPKTRSGKVMRRLLRKIITSKGQDLGDTTTLEDPSVISEILSAFQKYEDKRAATK